MGNDQKWIEFYEQFRLQHSEFIQRLALDYSKMSHSEFCVCCYLRAGYSNQQICEATGVGLRCVETTRYRLRKKLPIASSDNLALYLIKM
jgi:DNA-binding CsgD family transcriptional regulator